MSTLKGTMLSRKLMESAISRRDSVEPCRASHRGHSTPVVATNLFEE